MAQKFSRKLKAQEKQSAKQKARAVGRSFEISTLDDEFDDENEEEIWELKEDESENSPVDILDEDIIDQNFDSDFRWTSLNVEDLAVKGKKVTIAFVKTEEGIRAIPLVYRKEMDENMKVLFEIAKKVNERKFKNFEEMEGKFRSKEFGNGELSRKIVTNNYGIIEPYAKVIKLNFLTSKGRKAKKIDVEELKRCIEEIHELGLEKKGEISDRLINDYGYNKSIQRSKEFKDAYEEVKKSWQ